MNNYSSLISKLNLADSNTDLIFNTNKINQIYFQIESFYYESFVNSSDPKNYWFGMANISIIEIISCIIYKSYILKNNPSLKNTFHEFILDEIINANKIKYEIPFDKNIKQKIKSKIKYCLQYLKLLFKKKNLRTALHIGSLQLESSKYCDEKNFYPFILDIFSFKKLNNKHLSYELNLKNKKFISDIKNCYKHLNNNEILTLISTTSNILLNSENFYLSSIYYIKKIKGDYPYLATISGWMPNRNFIGACNFLGKEVIGFLHGYTSIGTQKPFFNNDSSSIVKKLIIPSKIYKEYYSSQLDLKKFDIIKPNLEIYKKNPYYEEFLKIKKKYINGKNDKNLKILLISYPKSFKIEFSMIMKNIHTSNILEKKIINFYIEKKFHIDLKVHPDREKEQSFLDNSKVNLVFGNLENIYMNYGILLFMYHRSTAFCYSLMTNMPIILVLDEDEYEYIDMGLLKKIENRCAIVRSYKIKNNKIDISHDDLLISIEESIKKKNSTTFNIDNKLFG